jgi:hypothetical protein
MYNAPVPLGYIMLPGGPYPVFPMNDLFSNYMYEDESRWEALRTIINEMIAYYNTLVPHTHLKPILGKIKVRTQYKQLVKKESTPTSQDIEITDEEGNVWYIEFQIAAYPSDSISTRSTRYFGVGISRDKKSPAEQIWLLAEDIPSLTHGQAVMRYVLKNEIGEQVHPNQVGILYVSLSKLSEQDTPAGEMAATLLGKIQTPTGEPAKQVAESLKSTFNQFKYDKEAVEMMTLVERRLEVNKEQWLAEGEAKGEARGEARGINKLAELIKKGLSVDEALQQLANA